MTEVLLTDPAAAEAHAYALEGMRRAVAQEHRELTRKQPAQIDAAWSDAMAANTARGLQLDKQRAAAWRVVRELRDRDARHAQWKAARAITGEHQIVCRQVVVALDALIPAVEAELRLHEQLRETVGGSQLHALRPDLTELRRLRESARLVTRPPEEKA